MADTKITLEFEATGADQVVGEIQKVEAAEEDLTLQQQRDARVRAGGVSALATGGPEAEAAAESEARRAANRLSIEKSMAEAQANRIAMAQEANRKQAEADVEQLVAAREKAALEEKQTASVLTRILARAAVPRSREATAVLSLSNNTAALNMLGTAAKVFATGPWGLLVAGMAAGGAAIEMAGKQFDRLKEAIPTAKLDWVTESLVHPWEAAKNGANAAMLSITDGLAKIGITAFKTARESVDAAIEAQKAADDTKKKYEEMVVAYQKMNDAAVAVLAATQQQESRFMNQALEDAGKLMKAQGGLDESRAKRGGATDGGLAVSAVERAVGEDKNAEEIARLAVSDADKKLADLLAKKNAESGTDKNFDAALDVEIAKAQTDSDIAARKLGTLIKEHDIQLTQSAEEAVDKVTTESGDKVTKMATDAMTVMQQVADQNGGQLQGAAKGAMDKLTAILADSIPDEQQVEAINQAMKAFRGSQDAANAGVVANFDGMLKCVNGLLGEIATHKKQIADMQQQISQMRGAR